MPRKTIVRKKRKLTKKPVNRTGLHNKKLYLRCFIRDKFTCRVCGKVNQQFEAHHLIPFSWSLPLRGELANLITVCKTPCHMDIMHLGNPKSLNHKLTIQFLIDNLKYKKRITNAQDYLKYIVQHWDDFK